MADDFQLYVPPEGLSFAPPSGGGNSQTFRPIAPLCVPDGTPACPFSSFAQSSGSPAGLHWFDVTGVGAMRLYADGTGRILLRRSTDDNADPIVAGPLTITDDGQYNQATTVALANMATTIIIRGPVQNQEVQTAHAYFLARLRNYQSLAVSGGSFTAGGSGGWTGNTSVMNRTCADSTLTNPFDVGVWHSCGNVGGVHWFNNQTGNLSRFVTSQTTNTVIEMWLA